MSRVLSFAGRFLVATVAVCCAGSSVYGQHHGGHFGGHAGFGGHHSGLHLDVGGHHGIGHLGIDHGVHHIGVGHDLHHGFEHHFGLLDHHDLVHHELHHYDHAHVGIFLYGGYYVPYYSYYYPYWYAPYGVYAPLPYSTSQLTVGSRRYRSLRNRQTPSSSARRRADLERDLSAEALAKRFLDRARRAFRAGSYRQAVRFAGHAAVEQPRSAEIHHTIAFAMFALGDYRGASSAVVAALSHGQPWRWRDVQALYGARIADYRQQLRGLEQHLRKQPNDVPARFLLAYQYVVLGYPREAIEQLDKLLAQAPEHGFAAGLKAWLREGRPRGKPWDPAQWLPKPRPERTAPKAPQPAAEAPPPPTGTTSKQPGASPPAEVKDQHSHSTTER